MGKKKITLCIDEDLLGRLRDAVYRSRLTLNGIISGQIEGFLRTDALINGKCPPRPHELLAKGRKLKEGEHE